MTNPKSIVVDARRKHTVIEITQRQPAASELRQNSCRVGYRKEEAAGGSEISMSGYLQERREWAIAQMLRR